MSLNQTKWTIEITEKLIKTKHSDQFCEKFTNATNMPKKMKECWQHLGEEFNPPLAGEAVKIKYYQLLSKFRDVQMECSRSGAGTSHWRYWEVFKNTFPKKIKTEMEDVIELGDESFSNISVADQTNNMNKTEENEEVVKRSLTSSYKQLKMDALKTFIDKSNKSSDDQQRVTIIEKRIDSL